MSRKAIPQCGPEEMALRMIFRHGANAEQIASNRADAARSEERALFWERVQAEINRNRLAARAASRAGLVNAHAVYVARGEAGEARIMVKRASGEWETLALSAADARHVASVIARKFKAR